MCRKRPIKNLSPPFSSWFSRGRIVKIDAFTLRVAIDETLEAADIKMMVAQITEELLLG
ncbi:MAG: hypothetical protein MZU79_02705 [Anaerotruncus sp.]|nr:hypothetical protein [Anaerotruncus sp.]